MSIGIVGTRHVHAAGLARLARDMCFELTGVAERDAVARAAWKAEHGDRLGRVVPLKRVLNNSTAVIVAGTNAERVDDCLAALREGCTVLSEKPVAVDEQSLERLVAEADPERYTVALPLRFSGAIARAKRLIKDGAIGTPLAGRGTNHGQYPGGWFGVRADAGGGAIMDHTVHVSDALCWILGERVMEVYAESARRMHDDIDVEDCAVLTMTFESGFFASLDASWSRPHSFHTWGDVWIEVVGTEGRLVVDPMAQHLHHYDDAAGKLHTRQYASADMNRHMLSSFTRLDHDGGPPAVTLDAGVHASDIVFAAYRSAASHRPEPVRERLLNLRRAKAAWVAGTA